MEKLYDVFISHHSDSTGKFIYTLSEILNEFHMRDWFSERDLGPIDNYAQKIPDAIASSRMLLLLLNEYANVSNRVLEEYQYAINKNIPILVARMDDCKPREEYTFLRSHCQFISVAGLEPFPAARQILKALQSVLENRTIQNDTDETPNYNIHRGNDLLFYSDEGERERLHAQHMFLYQFANDFYTQFLSEEGVQSFLDIGCNTGEQAFMFLKDFPGIRYFGIDREQDALDTGKEMYPDAAFYQGDCGSEALDDLLCEIEEENSLDGFDIINISMLLLHLDEQQAQTMMDILASHLSENGRLVVLDIDDGYNLAYPDEDNRFAKAVSICAETKYSGYRKSGRQVFNLLHDVGIRNAALHKIGLSTVGMNREERGKFFDIYFWLILDDLRKMCREAETAQDPLINSHLTWLDSNYQKMRFAFKKMDFFFTLGFMLYSGKKH